MKKRTRGNSFHKNKYNNENDNDKDNDNDNDNDNDKRSDSFKEETPDEISQTLKIDKEVFIIKFKKENNNVLILCIPIDEFACLYEYSIQITYEEFCKLGKNFNMCENIDDIFKILKNIVEGVKVTQKKGLDLQSYIKIEYSSDDTIVLIFKIPLLTGTYEEIKVEFKKTKKDINEQFKKLKEKYLQLKTLVINNNIQNIRNDFITEIMGQKKANKIEANPYFKNLPNYQ